MAIVRTRVAQIRVRLVVSFPSRRQAFRPLVRKARAPLAPSARPSAVPRPEPIASGSPPSPGSAHRPTPVHAPQLRLGSRPDRGGKTGGSGGEVLRRGIDAQRPVFERGHVSLVRGRVRVGVVRHPRRHARARKAVDAPGRAAPVPPQVLASRGGGGRARREKAQVSVGQRRRRARCAQLQPARRDDRTRRR